ncbi:MAG: hypothetical protein J6X70_03460 [Muribaculaceae bacterium]|nr:hypothetical protein [Muribaculaceae bacterium]
MKQQFLLFAAAALMAVGTARADDNVTFHWEAGIVANSGTEQLAPHHIAAESLVTQQHGFQVFAAVGHEMDTTARFSWSANVRLMGGYTSNADYLRWNDATASLMPKEQHPGRLLVEQLSAAVKYRCLFLLAGKDYRRSPLVDGSLSSGDLVMSGNVPLPAGARAGFIDYQNVPFTNGWLQIGGEVGYYKSDDSKWLENHYNQLNGFITTGYWLNYKWLHLRSNPSKPFVATIGMQAACQFGGTQIMYTDGVETERVKMDANAKAFFKALIPGSGGNANGDHYYEGNHVGSWDIRFDYRFHNGHSLAAYHQHPWEDGSGICFKNGFDGLWGLQYSNDKPNAPLGAVVVEYLDMTNHSGPLHFNPKDYTTDTRPDGSPIHGEATGADNYYNNYAYSGYSYRGQALGSPMLVSPLFNQDGYISFAHNVMRGFHFAATGHFAPQWQWTFKGTWRKSWGNIFMPLESPVASTSWLARVGWQQSTCGGWRASLSLALDRGKLTGDNFGALLSVSYHGNFSFNH